MSRRRIFNLLIAVVLTTAFLGAAPVGATTAFFFQQNGSNALTGTDPSCTGTGPYTCVAYFLNVFAGKNHIANSGNPDYPDGVHPGDRVCYEVDHWANASADPPADTDPITSYEFGCNRTVGQATFDHLSSATLSPTTIVLGNFECSPADPYPACIQDASATPVTISGTWTGIGPSSHFRANDLSRPVPFCFHFVETGRSRDAIPAGLPFTPGWSFLSEGAFTLTVSSDLRCV